MRVFNTTRRKIVAGVFTAGAALVLIPVAHAASNWGPSRPTFTIANPATYITFNSITDNPQVGDERMFYTVGDTNHPQSDSMQVQDNQEISLQVYFHNNAASNLNLVARDTKVSMLLPTTAATTVTSTAHITSPDANPTDVFDTATITGDRPFTLSYEPGTAKLWNNIFRGVQLSDSVVTSGGALVGYDKIDGNIPGCAKFSGYVSIRVRVHMVPAPQPQFACTELGETQIDRTRFDFTAHATAQNANVQSYVFTTSNSSGATVDTTTVSTNALSAVYHFNQSTVGTYTVSAVIHTDQGNTEQSSVCTKQVTVSAKPVVKAAVTTKTLPNTGPGEVAGLFAGASTIGAALHYAVRRRR